MKLDYPIVKDWAFVSAVQNPFIAPELIPSRLCGRVFGSDRFYDGTNIATSSIQRMFEEQGVIIIETKHSKYIIRKGEESFDYRKEMGDVWQKLITRINFDKI